MTAHKLAFEGFFEDIEEIIAESKHDPCPKCKDAFERSYSVHLASSGKQPPMPKYIPMIREFCGKCGVFIKWAKQTPDLMEKLDKELEQYKF